MKTGSLRARVILSTLAVLAVVLAGVVTAVTLAYRAKLNGDLHTRLARAGASVERAGSAAQAKRLLPGLALEGIAIHITPPPATAKPPSTPAKPATIQARGSLLVLDEVLPDETKLSFSASRTSIDDAVNNLLLIELLVAAAALALATLLVLQSTRTALRPLSSVIETARRIARGDSNLRLDPSRTDTELGSLAQAFDQMVDALERAIEEARASDAATRRFLADASHELRTPIAALQASIETLLREQPERPESDRLEAAVARESERLGRLVDDLLGLARLEAHPTRTPVDLAATPSRAATPMRSNAYSATSSTTPSPQSNPTAKSTSKYDDATATPRRTSPMMGRAYQSANANEFSSASFDSIPASPATASASPSPAASPSNTPATSVAIPRRVERASPSAFPRNPDSKSCRPTRRAQQL
jgi:two-component system, OmpR family, sensor kinase